MFLRFFHDASLKARIFNAIDATGYYLQAIGKLIKYQRTWKLKRQQGEDSWNIHHGESDE